MPSDARLLLFDKAQVESLLVPEEVLEAVREAFLRHGRGEGRVFPVVREPLTTGGVFGIKSGDIPVKGLLGLKAAGFWPSNRKLNSEPHQATIVLIDPRTGRPLCVLDGNAITAARTAAAGALGLLALARQESKRLCVFGTGVQACAHLTYALKYMPLLRRVRYVTLKSMPDANFEALFATRCELSHATDPNEAVAESDVVITATPSSVPLFDLQAAQPGTHFNCVGADTKGKRELPEGLLMRARLFVDDRIQAREIGETQWAQEQPSIELGELLAGRVDERREATDLTVFDLTGLALQDLMVAHLLHDRAVVRGSGLSIAWPW
jgi:alanine dehydrogenase